MCPCPPLLLSQPWPFVQWVKGQEKTTIHGILRPSGFAAGKNWVQLAASARILASVLQYSSQSSVCLLRRLQYWLAILCVWSRWDMQEPWAGERENSKLCNAACWKDCSCNSSRLATASGFSYILSWTTQWSRIDLSTMIRSTASCTAATGSRGGRPTIM